MTLAAFDPLTPTLFRRSEKLSDPSQLLVSKTPKEKRPRAHRAKQSPSTGPTTSSFQHFNSVNQKSEAKMEQHTRLTYLWEKKMRFK